jgi:uncharacterized membrane protein
MLKFLKNAIFRGLVTLLPVLFLIIILKEFAELLIGLATPIADLFPPDMIESIPEINILAALLIVAASFLVGVIALVPWGVAIGGYLDGYLLKVPVYKPLKGMLGALLGDDANTAFKPALIEGDSGDLEPAYIVEDTGRARLTVLVPWTPASFAGSMRFVLREKVHPLDITFDQFSLALGHYGAGLAELIPEAPEAVRIDVEPE